VFGPCAINIVHILAHLHNDGEALLSLPDITILFELETVLIRQHVGFTQLVANGAVQIDGPNITLSRKLRLTKETLSLAETPEQVGFPHL